MFQGGEWDEARPHGDHLSELIVVARKGTGRSLARFCNRERFLRFLETLLGTVPEVIVVCVRQVEPANGAGDVRFLIVPEASRQSDASVSAILRAVVV